MNTILFAGLGGQGVVTAADITAEALFRAGLDVKTSAIRGMSQRGAEVTCLVRYGERVFSPVPAKGTVDILAALDRNEAATWTGWVRPAGCILLLDGARSRAGGSQSTPRTGDPSADSVALHHAGLAELDPTGLDQGAPANLYLVGRLSRELSADVPCWHAAIHARFDGESCSVNTRAFDAGRA